MIPILIVFKPKLVHTGCTSEKKASGLWEELKKPVEKDEDLNVVSIPASNASAHDEDPMRGLNHVWSVAQETTNEDFLTNDPAWHVVRRENTSASVFCIGVPDEACKGCQSAEPCCAYSSLTDIESVLANHANELPHFNREASFALQDVLTRAYAFLYKQNWKPAWKDVLFGESGSNADSLLRARVSSHHALAFSLTADAMGFALVHIKDRERHGESLAMRLCKKVLLALEPLTHEGLKDLVTRAQMRAAAHACFKYDLKPLPSEPARPISVSSAALGDHKEQIATGLRMVEVSQLSIHHEDTANTQVELDHIDRSELRQEPQPDEMLDPIELTAEAARSLAQDLADLNMNINNIMSFLDTELSKGVDDYEY